jgi:hypothetical protein
MMNPYLNRREALKLILTGISGLALSRFLAACGLKPNSQSFTPIPAMPNLNPYHLEWNSPSTSSCGSMPAGNGDIGVNVWAEADGDLLFYISKTDALDENNRLVKLGRVRVAFAPNPFAAGQTFLQTLNLSEGTIDIAAGSLTLRLWVDANAPQVHLEIKSAQPLHVTAKVEFLRPERRRIEGQELHSAYDLRNAPREVWSEADTLFEASEAAVAWAHINPTSIWSESLELQGLGELIEMEADPLLGRAFGVWMEGSGKWKTSQSPSPAGRGVGVREISTSEPVTSTHLTLTALTRQVQDPAEWLDAVRVLKDELSTRTIESARALHTAWWRDFWQRSWILVSGDESAEQVTRGYLYQRYITACAGRGGLTVKFSGSIFTMDYVSEMWNGQQMVPENFSADYRRWGGPFWFQNTRLIYHPLLRSGDFEMLAPFFEFYRRTLPLARERTRLWYGHSGIFFPETMDAWGTYANSDYGWQRDGMEVGQPANPYTAYLWSGGLELGALLLDYYEFTGDTVFLREHALPLISEVLDFYFQHYPVRNGKLTLEHAQSIETYWDVTNPAPDIAGLNALTERLLALPARLTSVAARLRWEELQAILPDLPMNDGLLTHSETLVAEPQNEENPELYAIFPFRLYGTGKPDLDLARRTFAARRVRETGGWRQDAIQAAELGLTEDVRRMVAENFSVHDPQVRFPAFWGPNYDWVPDQDHGSVAMIALQTMLLQWDGDKIYLLPAWPKDWNVSFRLCAPQSTTITAEVRDGKLVSLTVDPQEREKDIV